MSEFTFQELSEIYRVEMYSNPLSKVRKNLYRVMAELLSDLRRECYKLESSNPESVMLLGARDRRSKAEMMVRTIATNRAHKIYLRALRVADGLDTSLDELTPEEERYYYDILKSTRRQLSVVDDYICPDNLIDTSSEVPFQEVPDGLILVRILEDLPEFEGPNRTYRLS